MQGPGAYNPQIFQDSKSWGNIPQKTVPWKGHYSQGGVKQEMKFQNFQIGSGGVITGNGSDAVGQFTISGQMSNIGDIKFAKTYKGAHTVNYSGKLVNGAIEGKWEVSGLSDTFKLELDALEVWEGWYEQGGQQQTMKFTLALDQNGVFGAGDDAVGKFVLRGQSQGNQVRFIKEYIGQHTVSYSGWTLMEGGSRLIRGYWDCMGANGKFELRNNLPATQYPGAMPFLPIVPQMPTVPGMPGMPGQPIPTIPGIPLLPGVPTPGHGMPGMPAPAKGPNDTVSEQKVGIRSVHGNFLRGCGGGEGSKVEMQPHCLGDEIWTLVTLGSGKIALKSAHGTFLRANPGGEGSKVDLAVKMLDHEKWEKVTNPNGTVSFKSHHNTFLRGHPGGPGAKADIQTFIGDWEKWTIVPK